MSTLTEEFDSENIKSAEIVAIMPATNWKCHFPYHNITTPVVCFGLMRSSDGHTYVDAFIALADRIEQLGCTTMVYQLWLVDEPN